MADPRTGYYVAGHDWPAMSTGIPLSEIYAAFGSITDEAVEAARASLVTEPAGDQEETGA